MQIKFKKDMIDYSFNAGQEMCTMENIESIGMVSKC